MGLHQGPLTYYDPSHGIYWRGSRLPYNTFYALLALFLFLVMLLVLRLGYLGYRWEINLAAAKTAAAATARLAQRCQAKPRVCSSPPIGILKNTEAVASVNLKETNEVKVQFDSDEQLETPSEKRNEELNVQNQSESETLDEETNNVRQFNQLTSWHLVQQLNLRQNQKLTGAVSDLMPKERQDGGKLIDINCSDKRNINNNSEISHDLRQHSDDQHNLMITPEIGDRSQDSHQINHSIQNQEIRQIYLNNEIQKKLPVEKHHITWQVDMLKKSNCNSEPSVIIGTTGNSGKHCGADDAVKKVQVRNSALKTVCTKRNMECVPHGKENIINYRLKGAMKELAAEDECPNIFTLKVSKLEENQSCVRNLENLKSIGSDGLLSYHL